MSRPKRALMITDSNQACFAKMLGCGFQEEELNRYAVEAKVGGKHCFF